MSIRSLQKVCWVAALLWWAPGTLFALGVGNIQVQSQLNEPLQAQFPLITRDAAELDQVQASLAAPEDFERVDLDYSPVLRQLQFEVVRTPDGGAVVQVTTDRAIREPFLTFLVEVNWERGRLLREYSILLDPPVRMVTPDPGRVDVRPAAPPPSPPPVSQTVEKQTQPAEPVVAEPAAAEVATPEPQAASEPEPAPPTPVSYPSRSSDYQVVRGDTLWRIAHEYRSDTSISINEMMVAILRANPQAFFQDNVNALSAGEILRIPSNDEIRAVGERVAFEAVRAHNQAWEDYRARLGASPPRIVESRVGDVPGTASTPPRSSTARVEVVPAREGGASPTGNPGTETDEELRQALALTQEQLLTGEQEGSELRSRVNDLESQVDKLERLVELKDAELAAFQEQLQLAAEETTPGDEGGIIGPGAGTDITDAEAADMELETADASLADASTPVAQAVDSPVVTTTPSRSRSGTWYTNPMYMAGAGAVVLLLAIAGWVMFGRNRGSAVRFEPAVVTGDSLAARILAGSKDRRDPAGLDDFETAHEVSAEPDGGVEVEELSEAVAAIEDEAVLQAAIAENPDDLEPRLELIEFYFGTGERERFQEEAEQLYADLGDPLDSRWLKVAELGRQLSPENPLFGGPEGQDVGGETADKDLEFLEFDLEEELEGVGSGGERHRPAGQARAGAVPEPEAEVKPRPGASPGADEDTLLADSIGAGLADDVANEATDKAAHEMADERAEAAGEAAPSDITQDLAEEIERELGIDLNAGATDAGDEEPETGLLGTETLDAGLSGIGAAEDTAATDDLEDFATLSLEAESEDGPETGASPESGADETPALQDSDFDTQTAAAPETPAGAGAPELAAEGLGLELMPLEEKGTGREAPQSNGNMEAPESVSAPAEMESDDEELDVEESVATKLDLARAYMDMGDPESARNMIEEVLSEGNQQQKAEAESLLGRI